MSKQVIYIELGIPLPKFLNMFLKAMHRKDYWKLFLNQKSEWADKLIAPAYKVIYTLSYERPFVGQFNYVN